MRNDTQSNSLIDILAGGILLPAGPTPTLSVDHSLANTATFIVALLATVAGTFTAKLQYSDDGLVWTDFPPENGNTITGELLTASGDITLYANNPCGRYTRVEINGSDPATYSVTGILAPLRHIGV